MAGKLTTEILDGVATQVGELGMGDERRTELAAMQAELEQVDALLTGPPADPTISKALPALIQLVTDVQGGQQDFSALGAAPVELEAIRLALAAAVPDWLANGKVTSAVAAAIEDTLA